MQEKKKENKKKPFLIFNLNASASISFRTMNFLVLHSSSEKKKEKKFN